MKFLALFVIAFGVAQAHPTGYGGGGGTYQELEPVETHHETIGTRHHSIGTHHSGGYGESDHFEVDPGYIVHSHYPGCGHDHDSDIGTGRGVHSGGSLNYHDDDLVDPGFDSSYYNNGIGHHSGGLDHHGSSHHGSTHHGFSHHGGIGSGTHDGGLSSEHHSGYDHHSSGGYGGYRTHGY